MKPTWPVFFDSSTTKPDGYNRDSADRAEGHPSKEAALPMFQTAAV